MSGKFKSKVKYQKKNFNIYCKVGRVQQLKANPQVIPKEQKVAFKYLDESKKFKLFSLQKNIDSIFHNIFRNI